MIEEELFTRKEMAQEGQLLSLAYQNGGIQNLEARYLDSKKVVNLEKDKIVSVVKERVNDFIKYKKIFSVWSMANLPKADEEKVKALREQFLRKA